MNEKEWFLFLGDCLNILAVWLCVMLWIWLFIQLQRMRVASMRRNKKGEK